MRDSLITFSNGKDTAIYYIASQNYMLKELKINSNNFSIKNFKIGSTFDKVKDYFGIELKFKVLIVRDLEYGHFV
ncbi:MAG: hypothetical protein ACOCWM_04215 [Cyclobacteriaceae bacterium]